MLAFGPVPSRRLGYSLGVNHIPPKHCPYACVYCQVGRTTTLEIERREFYPVTEVVAAAALASIHGPLQVAQQVTEIDDCGIGCSQTSLASTFCARLHRDLSRLRFGCGHSKFTEEGLFLQPLSTLRKA